MIYTHCFRVNAPLNDVVEFHRQSASMAAITPPPIVVQMHRAPSFLSAGDQMDFTMWLGPLPVHWVAQIEGAESTGFIDRQLQGPFRSWVHKHSFVPVDNQATTVHDEVAVELHERNWLWRIVGFGMWLGLPILFTYRKRRTRQLLEHRS
jgi:ligand-binding SRPBCC domain-containing protein